MVKQPIRPLVTPAMQAEYIAFLREALDDAEAALVNHDLPNAGARNEAALAHIRWGLQQAGGASGGWRRVVFSADCDEDGNCPLCGIDYAECGCPGPTQDEYEYEERAGGLYARRPPDR